MEIHFDSPSTVLGWSAIDDRVMGGLSRSQLRFDPSGHAVFEGMVSTDHGGGFASIRHSGLSLGRPGVKVYTLTVHGDGKRYKFNLRLDDAWDGLNYQAAFETPRDQWCEICLPVTAFEPRSRGRRISPAPPFDPSKVRQVGFLVGDGQEGPFHLQLRSIRCF